MDDAKWTAWEIQTSKRWEDLVDVMNYTNIDMIDYDHQRLVEYVLQLNLVLDQSEGAFSLTLIEETKRLLTQLYEYAVEHFDREEAFMDQYDLPDIEGHKREHIRILKMLKTYQEQFESGKVKLTKKLKFQLMDWLVQHINKVDCEFFQLDNWKHHLLVATSWQEVKPIICLIGIEEIDEQHQVMTDIVLQAIQQMSASLDSSTVDTAFKNIIEYAKFHFAFEASFLERFNIAESERHLKKHDYFIETMETYAQSIQEDPKQLEALKGWFLAWWIQHINTIDKHYFDYNNWAYQLIESVEDSEAIQMIIRKTGFEDIDQEHMNLVAMTLSFDLFMRHNTAVLNTDEFRQQAIVKIEAIYKAAAVHFDREEQLMQTHGSQEFHRHQQEHAEILRKLTQFRDNYMSGRLVLSDNLKKTLLEWWFLHTNAMDYRTFVRNWS